MQTQDFQQTLKRMLETPPKENKPLHRERKEKKKQKQK